MRAFIAIDMPDDAQVALEVLQADLPAGTPAPPENLHLTLAFLGEQPLSVLETAHGALLDICARPFDLQLMGVDSFGGNDPKVVFAAVKTEPALDQLHRKIRSKLHGCGIMLERKRFRPHITLARFRRRPGAVEMDRLRDWLLRHSDFQISKVPVTHFTFYQSTLARTGAIHEELARYPLLPS